MSVWKCAAKILFTSTEIPISTICIRCATSGTANFSFTFHSVKFRLSMHQYHQVHHNREGEAIKGGDENNGISFVASLDCMVCQMFHLHDHHCDIDDCFAQNSMVWWRQSEQRLHLQLSNSALGVPSHLQHHHNNVLLHAQRFLFKS